MPDPLRVLLVDGDDDEASIVRGYLEEGLGSGALELTQAASGREALGRIGSDPPDILVVDRRLQGGEGLSFVRELRSCGVTAPVLFLDETGSGDLTLEALRAGATDTVVKSTMTGPGLAAAVRHSIDLQRSEGRRRDAEQALRRSEAYHRALIDHSLDLITICDEGFVFRFVNAASERLLGFSPEELLGRQGFDLVHPDDRAHLEEAVRLAISSPGLAPLVTVRLRHEDGSYRHFESSGVSLFADPVIRGLVVSSRDVSARIAAEEALRRHDAILEAVGFAAERFLGTENWETEAAAVLTRLGEAANVSRAYLFENRVDPGGKVTTYQRFEWAAPGTTAEIDNPDLQDLDWEKVGFGRWATVLSGGGVIAGLVAEMSEAEQAFLGAESILSILTVPVFVDGRWWGIIGFDDCASARVWTTAERGAIQTAARVFAAAIRSRGVRAGATPT